MTTMNNAAATAGSIPIEYRLAEDNELRFEVTSDEGDAVLELIDGDAEVFGTELVLHQKYVFPPGSRVAVFTWHSAVVELCGKTESPPYVAKHTPMVIYVNTHAALEQQRQYVEARVLENQADVRGPRVMVVGPTDVGKSTYCRILCNYAVRQGRNITFVDLDVGQGFVSVPGTIGALYIERPADVVEGFDRKTPLVYHFGWASPARNIPLYDLLVKELVKAVNRRCKSSQEANCGGVVINTCGWVKGDGYHCLVNAAEAFEVDVVVVIDHERLYNELQGDLPNFVKIVHQPKSGGVEERSQSMRKAARQAAIHKYFYGTRQQSYNPHTFELSYDEVTIVKIGADEVPDSCLPFGMKPEEHRTKVVTVPINAQLVHHLFGVSTAESITDVLTSNMAGFICITRVDSEKRTISVVSPQPYPLPRTILVLSDVTFDDDNARE